MQAALAAEQAASYGYGVVGSHLTGSRFTAATADCVAHERARDALTAMIAARGGQPASGGGRLPAAGRRDHEHAAMALAVVLERQVTAAYLGLVAASDRPCARSPRTTCGTPLSGRHAGAAGRRPFPGSRRRRSGDPARR